MFTSIFGLPTHVLVIHFVVVGIPAAAIASALVAARRGWRDRFGWWVLGLDVIVVLITWLARETGINLFNALPAFTRQQATVIKHRNLGLSLIWFVLALFVAVAVPLAADRRLNNRVLSSGLGVIVLAAAVLALVRVYQTGDAGAHAVWNGVIH